MYIGGELALHSNMIDFNHLLDQFPQVSNRGVIQLIPTKLYIDWYNYISEDGNTHSINNIEPISFLIADFDTRQEFDDWLEGNYQLLFEIRLNYACIIKSQWPVNRTLKLFLSWFDVYYSSLILDLRPYSIEII
jgi:hypothetical protein